LRKRADRTVFSSEIALADVHGAGIGVGGTTKLGGFECGGN
jgi:hypothetical protein